MKQRELEILTQRVNLALQSFPETRKSDSALVFRVLLLYGANYSMTSADAEVFPSVEEIFGVRDQLVEAQ